MPTNKPAKPETAPLPDRQRPRSIEELKALVLQGRDEITVDPKEVEQRIFDRMMSATTPEEALGASVATQAKDILGKNILINSVEFHESDFDDGLGIFAVINGVVNGETMAITCGARTVIAQLMKFDYEGWFPARVKLHQSTKPTAKGYLPMEMIPGDPVEAQF